MKANDPCTPVEMATAAFVATTCLATQLRHAGVLDGALLASALRKLAVSALVADAGPGASALLLQLATDAEGKDANSALDPEQPAWTPKIVPGGKDPSSES